MDTLKERVDDAIYDVMVGNKPKLHKDIYFHKSILAPAHESVHGSFRFYNKHKNYFVFSVTVQLKNNLPVVICNICLLCPKRFFIRKLNTFMGEIPIERQIPQLMSDIHISTHYKLNRTLPAVLLHDEFVNLVKPDFDKYFKEVLEEEDIKW